MRWSPEGQRAGLGALAVGVAVLGVAASRQGFAWSDTRSWVPDLLTGWTLACLGVVAAALGRSRGAACLLVASGVAWFIGDFHATGPSWFGELAVDLSWVFLAPLVGLALAFPSGRPHGLVTLILVAATWVAVLTPWVDWNDDRTLVAAMGALALAGSVSVLYLRREGVRRSLAGVGGLVLLFLWALVVPTLSASLQPIGFEVGVALVGVWLFVGLSLSGDLTERAIELDESTGTLRDALAELLGDPQLDVAFPSDTGGFVDERGDPVRLADPGRRATELSDASGVVGIVVHDLRVLTSPGDREAVSVAVALAGTRARLRQDLRRRADEVHHSTLRLIMAEDDERRRLSARLDAGTGCRLHDAARLLADARGETSGESELEASLDQAERQLERARSELDAIAGGLGVPALVSGLPSAVGELVEGLPLDVDVRVADLDCASELAATIWFVCSEGVTNVLKHAIATRLLVEVAEDTSGIRVVVEDDGRGGADANGSGLGGLRDRVAALGGSLRVERCPEGGTRLAATLPRMVVAA